MGIGIISLLLVFVFIAGVARYARAHLFSAVAVSVVWLGLFAVASLSGVLAKFDARPPPMAFMFFAVLFGGIALGRSRMLNDTVSAAPLWSVVLVQSFRLPLELVMHDLARRGIMPNEMSFSGYNFDIVTGATAIVVAATRSERLAFWWNVLGSVLLAVIVAIALLATPVVRAFGDGQHVNTFVAHFPYVYLPAVCVLAAFALHIALFRRLSR